MSMKLNQIIYDTALQTVQTKWPLFNLERLRRRSREKSLVIPRHIFHYLTYRTDVLTFKQIGRYTQRHHSSVINSRDEVNNMIFGDKIFRATIFELETEFRRKLKQNI